MHSQSPDHRLNVPTSHRVRLATTLANAGLFCLPALVVAVSSNLLPFAVLLLASSVLVPDLIWRARAQSRPASRTLAILVLLSLAGAVLSLLWFDQGLRDVDNRSRFVVMPWIVLWCCALQLHGTWLWRGALAGLLLVLLLSVLQVAGGAPRADLYTNAIVLADIVLVLMVLMMFLRPPGLPAWGWVGLGVLAGGATIVLSGSRGVFLALAAAVLVLVLSLRWGSRRLRLSLLAAAVLGGSGLLLVSPELREQMRLTELHQDVQRLERGDTNSSAGARVERLQVAYDAFVDHPWTGVGIGRFDTAMQRLPLCSVQPDEPRCHLGHAHNDLAEWAATQGIPGVLLLLAAYGLPAGLFCWLHRRSGRDTFRGPAAAGLMVVISYVLCGLTQSMFAHQITASFYVSIVALLAGLSRVEGVVRARTVASSG